MSAIVQRRKRYRPTPMATARVNAKKANLKLPRRYHAAKPAMMGSITSVYGFIVPTMVPRAKSRIPSFFEHDGRPLARGISELVGCQLLPNTASPKNSLTSHTTPMASEKVTAKSETKPGLKLSEVVLFSLRIYTTT